MLKRFRKAITRTISAIVVMTLVLTSQYGMVEADEISDASGNISEISTNDIYGNVSTEEDEQRDIAIDSAFVDTTRDVLADEVEKDASGNIEGLTDRFGEDEFDLDTDRITDPAELENVKLIPYMLSTRKIETVGADGYNIINGADYVSYGEAEFLGLSDGIYKKEGNSETKVSDDIASNFNVLGNNIVFTTIKDGKYAIEGIDANTFEFAFEYLLDDYKIKQMYVINDECFFILSDGDIYAIGMYDLSIDRLTTQGDIFSFIPTTEGVLYATGSLFDYDVYYGKTKILDSVSDWFTTEYGVVYRTRDAIEKQIKYVDMKSVTLAKRAKAENNADAILEAVAQISNLSTDGDDRMVEVSADKFIEEVVKVDESYSSGGLKKRIDYNTTYLTRDAAPGNNAITNEAQRTIVYRADSIYKEVYKLHGDIIGYTEVGQPKNLIPQKYWEGDEEKFTEIHGILYGMPSIHKEGAGYVFYNCTWEDYKEYVNNKNSKLYSITELGEMARRTKDGAIVDYSPQYSLDCSGFVSYCYETTEKYGTSNIPGSNDFTYISGTDLKGVQVGDALNWAGEHVVLVTAIKYDSTGKICFIEITEQTPSWTQRKSYESIAKLQKERLNNHYKVYRKSTHSGISPELSQSYAELAEGETLNLYVKSAGPMPIAEVTWMSSNENVAIVDRTGRVTAKNPGTATITATIGKDTTESTVYCTVVVSPTVVSITPVSGTLYTVSGYNKIKLSASASSGMNVTWSSSDSLIASVDSNGNVTGKSSGTVTISAKAGSGSATCTIVVKEPTLSLPSAKEIYVTESINLTATATPASTITWTSSNSSIATVTGGKVTGKSAGKCTITATANGKSASCTVTVMAPSINMNRTDITKYIGESFTFTASVHPSATVTWTTTDSRVARVSGGVTTAVGVGTCNIKATANGVTATAKFTVLKPSISLNTSTLRLYKGEKYLIGATVAPSGRTVRWTTSNSSVATVASDGRVTAVGAGTATITASIDGAQASCTVTVNNKSLTISSTSVSLYKGQTTRITASTAPSATVSWLSSNTSVATVSGGTITAKGAGTCTITASANGLSAYCTVKVTNPSLRISQTSLNLKKGSSATLTATTTPSTSISWSSSDTKVATVSGGKVTAKSKGRCVISAKANGLTVTCSVTVQ